MTCIDNNDEEILTSSIYGGDDTGAFGRKFIKINAPKGIKPNFITKCEFQCGDITHEEINPTFPYYINFSTEDTKKLKRENYCYLRIYDSKGRPTTLKGTLRIIAKKQVVFSKPEKDTDNKCTCSEKRVRF